MAVTLRVTGNGRYQGSSTAIANYSVSEESTPTNPADTTGGTGQFTFDVVEDASAEGTLLLLHDTVEIEDGSNGRTAGDVSSLNISNGIASVAANSRLNQLVTTKASQPFAGTLEHAFQYYMRLANIEDIVVVDPAIADRLVVYPGFEGNLWDTIKQICAVEQIEVSLVSSNIIIRPLRTRIVETRKHSSESIALDTSQIAQRVEVHYYNNVRKENALVYPKGGWTSEIQSYQVDAGELLEVDIPVDVSLESILQPECVSFVARDYSGPSSVYAIAGNDGLPIPPAQWLNGGGSVQVSIGSDTKTIHLKVRGASESRYAPYTIAVTAGTSDRYSSLRLVGTGVHFDKKLLSLPTGIDPSSTSNVVGVTIDNPFINTLTDAYNAGVRAAGAYGGPSQTISIQATVVNRRGDAGSLNYASFEEFDERYAGYTFEQFDDENYNYTFAQLDEQFIEAVRDNFENQAFGNVAGGRVKYRESWYRIRSATITPEGISYTAERDTLFSDFDELWDLTSFEEFDARFAGKTFRDFDMIPLWKPQGSIAAGLAYPSDSTYPSDTLYPSEGN